MSSLGASLNPCDDPGQTIRAVELEVTWVAIYICETD
jgi:hypothetical protein